MGKNNSQIFLRDNPNVFWFFWFFWNLLKLIVGNNNMHPPLSGATTLCKGLLRIARTSIRAEATLLLHKVQFIQGLSSQIYCLTDPKPANIYFCLFCFVSETQHKSYLVQKLFVSYFCIGVGLFSLRPFGHGTDVYNKMHDD